MAWFYLRNALGFLIQFGGPMALCFLPWGKESYRFPRKITLGCFIAALFLFSALFPLPFALREPSWLSLWANGYMLGAFLVCCAAYFFFIREHFIQKLLVVNFALVYAVAQYMTVSIACTVKAECGKLPLSPVDLTVILANALENAVRAAGETNAPWLDVKIGVVGGSLAVEVENSCAGVKFAGGKQNGGVFLPASAFASERKGGGLWLRSIARRRRKAAYPYYKGKRLNAVPIFSSKGIALSTRSRVPRGRFLPFWKKDCVFRFPMLY